jgi:hypothetical protein
MISRKDSQNILMHRFILIFDKSQNGFEVIFDTYICITCAKVNEWATSLLEAPIIGKHFDCSSSCLLIMEVKVTIQKGLLCAHDKPLDFWPKADKQLGFVCAPVPLTRVFRCIGTVGF